jgi:hypothetical protein
MAKTIDDYKKDYEDAKAAGNAEGMRAATDAANQLRNANGESAQYANTDIASVSSANDNNDSGEESGGGGINRLNSAEDAYYKEQVKALDAEKEKIDPYYYNVRNNAAATQAQNKSAFNEYAAANGLNSGAGGQAELARQNVYGNAINAADVAEANAYSDIESQVRELSAQKQLQKDAESL